MLLQAMIGGWRKAGLGLLFCHPLLIANLRCEAQNLIPNHSFEERDSCLEINTWYYPETGPLGWFSAGGTGDYYLSCLPYGAFNGVPLSAWAFQYPQEGDAYVGVITYDEAFGSREYFAIEMTEPLEPGVTYNASFYASASWNGNDAIQAWLASSGIGMRFATQAVQWEWGMPNPAVVNSSQVYHPWILADTVNWVLVSGSFVADSAYRYVLLGNHFNNANTDTLQFGDYPVYARAHTLIDNVCVSTDPLGCPLATGVGESGMIDLGVYPNPAIDAIAVVGLKRGAKVRIHEASGREVWNGPAESTWVLDVKDWARGLYVLRVNDTGGNRSLKFVLTQ